MEIVAVHVGDGIEESLFERLLGTVPEPKRSRIARFRKRDDAVRSLAGELLVRTWAAERLGLGSGKLRYAFNEYGKPAWADEEGRPLAGAHFNLTHSGEWVAAAFDDGPVGIDVERVEAVPPDIAGRILSPEEAEEWERAPEEERQERLCRIWTLKESYVKAIGRGLSEPLRSFAVLPSGRGADYVVRPAGDGAGSRGGAGGGGGEDGEWYCKSYEISPSYRLSVCSPRRDRFPADIVRRELATVTRLLP